MMLYQPSKVVEGQTVLFKENRVIISQGEWDMFRDHFLATTTTMEDFFEKEDTKIVEFEYEGTRYYSIPLKDFDKRHPFYVQSITRILSDETI